MYHTIFTVFDTQLDQTVETRDWKKAYEQLQIIIRADIDDNSTQITLTDSLSVIRSMLLRAPENFHHDVYHAWLLCAFVPWARVRLSNTKNPRVKTPPNPVTMITQEAIKIDKKTARVVENAVVNLDGIIQIKDAAIGRTSFTTSPLKRKLESPTRLEQGMAIRRWGPHWRSSVLYAMLTQVVESTGDSRSSSNCQIFDADDIQITKSFLRATQNGSQALRIWICSRHMN